MPAAPNLLAVLGKLEPILAAQVVAVPRQLVSISPKFKGGWVCGLGLGRVAEKSYARKRLAARPSRIKISLSHRLVIAKEN